jgi:hypothetical protein
MNLKIYTVVSLTQVQSRSIERESDEEMEEDIDDE